VLWIEQHREAFGVLVELKAVEGAPLSRNGVAVDFNTFENSTKAHGLRVEQPGCVARLKDHWFHLLILALKDKPDVRFTFAFRDDLRRFWLHHPTAGDEYSGCGSADALTYPVRV
jgi:hypothetical protein